MYNIHIIITVYNYLQSIKINLIVAIVRPISTPLFRAFFLKIYKSVFNIIIFLAFFSTNKNVGLYP